MEKSGIRIALGSEAHQEIKHANTNVRRHILSMGL